MVQILSDIEYKSISRVTREHLPGLKRVIITIYFMQGGVLTINSGEDVIVGLDDEHWELLELPEKE